MNGSYFALWLNRDGSKCWDGPFLTIAGARQAVPRGVAGSLVVNPLAMTPGEKLEALALLRRQS